MSLKLKSKHHSLSFLPPRNQLMTPWQPNHNASTLNDNTLPPSGITYLKVGVNPSLKREMWLLMDLITKKTCAKMYKSIHFWNQKNQMNPMVVTDFCKIMRFSRNSSVTMVTIEFFLDSITKIWFY